jgi:hypothetical protein
VRPSASDPTAAERVRQRWQSPDGASANARITSSLKRLEVADIRGTDTNTADGKVLITAHVDKATNADIEEFRWVNRCEGEAEIIRQLIARGLKAAS